MGKNSGTPIVTLLRKKGEPSILAGFPWTFQELPNTGLATFFQHDAMKSERRHQLETNLLADQIDSHIQQIKKLLPAILGGTAIVLIVGFGWGLYSNHLTTQAARGWTQLYFSDTESQTLAAISSEFEGTTPGLWALMTAGDSEMNKAVENWALDRDVAEQYYKQAVERYKVVVNKAPDSILKGKAHFGLAQALEGLGQREQAVVEYRKVAAIGGMPPDVIAESGRRALWLESKAGEEFFAWYKNNRPSAPLLESPKPNRTIPGAENFTLPSLSDIIPGSAPSNTSLPGVPGSNPLDNMRAVAPNLPNLVPLPTDPPTDVGTEPTLPPTLDNPSLDPNVDVPNPQPKP